METKANRDKVLQELRTHLSRDRARTKAFAVSDLGLIEMTRQRVRQSHLQNMTEACPTCHGTGRVFTAETIVRRVERSVRRMALEGKKDPTCRAACTPTWRCTCSRTRRTSPRSSRRR